MSPINKLRTAPRDHIVVLELPPPLINIMFRHKSKLLRLGYPEIMTLDRSAWLKGLRPHRLPPSRVLRTGRLRHLQVQRMPSQRVTWSARTGEMPLEAHCLRLSIFRAGDPKGYRWCCKHCNERLISIDKDATVPLYFDVAPCQFALLEFQQFRKALTKGIESRDTDLSVWRCEM